MKFLKKVNSNKVIRACEGKESQVCFRRIHEYAMEKQGQAYNVFKTEHPLKNMKLYHFHHNDTRNFATVDRRYIGERPKKNRANSDPHNPTNAAELLEKVQRIDSNMTTQGSDVDPAESLSHDLLIERHTHTCELKEGIEEYMRRIYKKRAELMNEVVMLEQGTVQDSLDKLLAYQVKRRDMPEWDEIELRYNTSKEEDANQAKGEERTSPTLYGKEAYDSDEEIEDNDMIEIMANNTQTLEPPAPEDGTVSTVNIDSRRGTEMSGLNGFSIRDSEATDNDDEDQKEPHDNDVGFFGMEMQDSEEDGEGLLPHKNNYHSSRFSFLDSNMDKFTVLQFIEKQALNISQVASNQKSAKEAENS